MQTDMEGKLRFNFDVPLRSRRFTLIAEGRDGNGGRRVVVPLNLNREVNADMQLMPEGGSLVAGLLSKTGFKAVGEDGKGIDVNGTILDSKGKQVAAFQSTHKGIGSFVFTPVSNETYTAKVSLPKGAIKSYGLPAIKPSGMVLTVNSIPGRDSIILSVQATADIINTNSSYSLIGQSGGKVCFASTVKFKDGSPVINGRVAKSKFPSGVARFTLFNNTGEPIAERIIFIDHHDRLHIKLTTDKPKYDLNDSVNLDISVTDNDSKPVQGSFSLAVTDDSQVKTDSINVPDISSYMLLQSELKGNIEEPGYYFNDPTPETDLRLDNLLLTQGWVAYDWTRVFDKTSQPKYKAERGFEVSGSVTKASGKPIPGLKISLLSTKKPVLFMDTVSNSLGRFTFTNLQPTDTPAFLVQMKDNKTRMFEARLNVDDFTPAATAGMYVPNLIPWYVNSDTTVLNFNRQNIALQREAEKMRFPAGSNVLNEVVIKARKIIKGSKFFAGVGTEPDLVLDEKDMLKAGKLTLEDVLLKNVKGFGAKMFPCSKPVGINYMVYCCPAVIYIDGMYIGSIYTPPPSGNSVADFYGFQQSYLQNITAEDVRGIEVFTRQGIGCYTIIEVTTWSKQGVYIKRMHGRYLYRPMPVTWSKQFYKPKYTAKPDPLFDLRSTVQWQPDVVTDEQGKARLWFKLKSKKAAYTLVLQGTDLDGHTGGIRKKLS
ncbi:MAG: carboxypeptidase-like regulatory domain-containing protein, partial [Mucilaginibacter sp.]